MENLEKVTSSNKFLVNRNSERGDIFELPLMAMSALFGIIISFTHGVAYSHGKAQLYYPSVNFIEVASPLATSFFLNLIPYGGPSKKKDFIIPVGVIAGIEAAAFGIGYGIGHLSAK